MLKEYDNIKEEIKKFQDFKSVHQRKLSIFKRMLSHCLKCRKMQKVQIQKLQRPKTEEQCFYENAQCVIVENQELSKSKKLADYKVV